MKHYHKQPNKLASATRSWPSRFFPSSLKSSSEELNSSLFFNCQDVCVRKTRISGTKGEILGDGDVGVTVRDFTNNLTTVLHSSQTQTCNTVARRCVQQDCCCVEVLSMYYRNAVPLCLLDNGRIDCSRRGERLVSSLSCDPCWSMPIVINARVIHTGQCFD